MANHLQKHDYGRDAPNGVAAFMERLEHATSWHEQLTDQVAGAQARMDAQVQVTMHAMDEVGSLTRHQEIQALCTLLAVDQATRQAEEDGADLGDVVDFFQQQRAAYLRTLGTLNGSAAGQIVRLSNLSADEGGGVLRLVSRLAGARPPLALASPEDDSNGHRPRFGG